MSFTPIIIGVGDFKNPSTKPKHALEPSVLMLKAIERALLDTEAKDVAALQKEIDSIDVVATWSWPYPDLPGTLAQGLGVHPKHKFLSEHGGNQPAKLVDNAARRISKGETKVAVVTGGEALASRMF
jgi:acetyl-CoA acetyltransferase